MLEIGLWKAAAVAACKYLSVRDIHQMLPTSEVTLVWTNALHRMRVNQCYFG